MARKRKAAPAAKRASAAAAGGLSQIDHFVVLMLENRSFDHLLGFLYEDSGNQSPLGHPFEGLTGTEQNNDSKGNPTPVFKIQPNDPYRYFYPKADPGEGFHNTNAQLFGTTAPAAGAAATNGGFITNFGSTVQWQQSDKQGHWNILPGTVETDIMGIFTPDLLPVLSGLAKGYAVCDHWHSSAPTETLPNRAFALGATSQGHLDDSVKVYTAPSIFTALEKAGATWAVYGYTQQPLTKNSVSDISQAPAANFGVFSDFQAAVKKGSLANFTFLEPSWDSQGNSQHPNYDVAAGEALIQQVYETLFGSPVWESTLLVITYDEHGGCYDHVAPPSCVAPDASAGEYGFGFDRLGVRVPAVLVSPWIEAGTVYRVTQGAGGTPLPFDHTSLLKTVEKRFGLQPLTQRDAAALDLGGVFTLSSPRQDDPLKGVTAPTNPKASALGNPPSHLQGVQAEALAGLPRAKDKKGVPHRDHLAPAFKSGKEADAYIRKRNRELP